MKKSFFHIWARILIPAGLVLFILSLWMLFYQEKGTAEQIISFINIGLGLLLTLIGVVLSRMERVNRDDS